MIMKTAKIISVCKTDCDSKSYKMVQNSRGGLDKVLAYHKVTRNGFCMYVEIETLPSGKKVSTTKHGPLPKG